MVLLKWKDTIPKQCASDFAKFIIELTNYLDEYSPECPICGCSVCEIDLSRCYCS